MANGDTKQTISVDGFVLTIPGIDTIGFFSHCSGLEMNVDVYEYHEGGNNDFVHHLPGNVTYPKLVLSRGLTNEDALVKWFDATATQADRKDITLTFKSGSAERKWTFAEAFPVRWTGPVAYVNGGGIASETLEIVHSGIKPA